jgi:hypothetical protein
MMPRSASKVPRNLAVRRQPLSLCIAHSSFSSLPFLLVRWCNVVERL